MRLLALGLIAVTSVSAAPAEFGIDKRAQAVIERTRTTHANYSVFTWNRITRPSGDPVEEWSAEFNYGKLHRVETPRDRLVADCDAQTGTYFGVTTMKVLSGPSIAKAACGVQANSRILSASFDGTGNGPFGRTDRITIHDTDNVRTYEVAANGAIVRATIGSEDGATFLTMWAIALEQRSPKNIFSEESLAASAVPEKYRFAPADLAKFETPGK